MRILFYLLWHRAEETVRPAIPAVALSVAPRAGGGRIALVAKDEALVRRTLTRAGWQVLVLLCHKTRCRV
ncbi:MAG TPA: hypothetical protein VK726_26340 [Acetobacteraceae bacterium]|jgi:hypothetical protein|nr:hypothetical protein [Acetobacteraceae bacterium]